MTRPTSCDHMDGDGNRCSAPSTHRLTTSLTIGDVTRVIERWRCARHAHVERARWEVEPLD